RNSAGRGRLRARKDRSAAPWQQDHRVQEEAAQKLPPQAWASAGTDHTQDRRDFRGGVGPPLDFAATLPLFSIGDQPGRKRKDKVRPATAATAPGSIAGSRFTTGKPSRPATFSCASLEPGFIRAATSVWDGTTRSMRASTES